MRNAPHTPPPCGGQFDRRAGLLEMVVVVDGRACFWPRGSGGGEEDSFFLFFLFVFFFLRLYFDCSRWLALRAFSLRRVGSF